MKVIHAENSLDLGEESRQEPEVSSGHPNEACYYLRNELLVGEDNAGRRPSFFKQFLDLRRIERAELTSIAALILGDNTLRAPRSSLDFRARATVNASDTDLPMFERFERRRLRRPTTIARDLFCSKYGWIIRYLAIATFRTASDIPLSSCMKDITTNNYEQLRQIILEATS